MQQSGSPFLTDTFDMTQQSLWEFQNSLLICSIGQVVAVTGNKASIQPLVNYFDKNNGFQTMPVLQNVRIAQLFSNTASIQYPVTTGDTGIILWFDREIETALKANTPSDPSSGSLSNANACVFLPFLSAQAPSVPLPTDGVKINSLTNITTQSAVDTKIQATGNLNLSGLNVNIEANAKLAVEANIGADFTSANISLLETLISLNNYLKTFATEASGVATVGDLANKLVPAAIALSQSLAAVGKDLTTFKG